MQCVKLTGVILPRTCSSTAWSSTCRTTPTTWAVGVAPSHGELSHGARSTAASTCSPCMLALTHSRRALQPAPLCFLPASSGGTTGTATRRQSCMKARTAGSPASGATRSVHSTTPFTQTSPRIQRCMRPVSRWSRRRRTTIKQDIVVACNERDLLRRGLKLLEARE